MDEVPFDVVQGGRAGEKPEEKQRRIVIVPTEAGSVLVVDRVTFAHCWLTQSIELVVPDAAVRGAVVE